MTLDNIIAFAGLLLTVILIAVRQGSRISVLEAKYDDLNSSLRVHENLNEKSFTRIEDELKEINEKLNKLIGYIEAERGQFKK